MLKELIEEHSRYKARKARKAPTIHIRGAGAVYVDPVELVRSSRVQQLLEDIRKSREKPRELQRQIQEAKAARLPKVPNEVQER